MKKIEIFGDNRIKPYEAERVGCRGIVIKDGNILVSRAKTIGEVMIPGGGLENGETLADCCRRELEEETGYIVDVGECFLEIDEYYGEYKFADYYYACAVVGEGKRQLTDEEKEVGMTSVWMDVGEFVDTLSRYGDHAESDEERSGMYLREFTAMREYVKMIAESELTAYCGVDCSACPDYKENKCPGCRRTEWKEGDACLPVDCCGKKNIPCCGACPDLPCGDMKEFYKESESHEAAGRLMDLYRNV